MFNVNKREQDISVCKLPVKRSESLLIGQEYLQLTNELMHKVIKNLIQYQNLKQYVKP